jgi:PleD family two-component response regulator
MTPRVTISIGVSSADSSSVLNIEKAEHVTHAADQGVYHAKETGRNRVCVCEVHGTPRIASQGVGYTLQAKQPTMQAAAPATSAGAASPRSTSDQAKTGTVQTAKTPLSTPAAAKIAVANPAVSKPAQAESVAASAQPGKFNTADNSAPASPAQPIQPPAAGATPPKPSGAGLLVVVENDPLASKLIELLFSKRTGMTVKIFDSAEAMLSWSVSPSFVTPALILSDCQLPGLKGVNVVAVVRSHPNLRDVPIAMMSSRVDNQLLASAQDVCCSLLISKADLCTSFDATLARLCKLTCKSFAAAG